MAIPVIEPVRTTNHDLARFQEAVRRSVDPLVKLPTSSGHLLEGVELAAGLNELSHRLGRPLRGYHLVRANADVRLWDDADASPAPDKLHRLQSSAAATVSLWVF